MSFERVLSEHFAGALPEEKFVLTTSKLLKDQYGFDSENTLACVGLCRDELCQSLFDKVEFMYGEPFDFRSLGGMIWAGRTGFSAMQSHSPLVGGRERYVFFVFAHIGIGPGGEVGSCERTNRPGDSIACGALNDFLLQIQAGNIGTLFDPLDVEQSLLKQRLLPELDLRKEQSLITLTKAAHRASLVDMEALITDSIKTERADYAVFSGVQIHGFENRASVWPGYCYVVVKGKRVKLSFETS